MISINEHSPNSNTSDDYKYYEVKNVTNYNYHDFSSYRINIRENAYTPDTNTQYYLILDTTFSDALFHWIAECAIFFPLFTSLKKIYSNLKMIFKTPKNYHTIIVKIFNIREEDISYSIETYNNICFFPNPITALNKNDISEEYIMYANKMIEYFNIGYEHHTENQIEKTIEILILPKQINSNSNSNQQSGQRISNCIDIIKNIENIEILHTDTITDFKEQIEKIKKAKTIIVTDGSPYLLNGLFACNSKIIVLGDMVKGQCKEFLKMNFYGNLIKSKNNNVIFIPYLHGDFYNNIFKYDDILQYTNNI